MSTEINLFDYRRASTTYRGGTVALSFHGPGTSIVSIHLPVDAEAIVTAFAEAFNAHMAGETSPEGVERATATMRKPTSYFNSLSPENQKFVLAYEGDDTVGDPADYNSAEAFNAHMSGETPKDGAVHLAVGEWLQIHPRAPRPLTIEAGKYYRTRDGQKVGPMKFIGHNIPWSWGGWLESATATYSFGVHGRWDITEESNLDLIAEWTDTPTPEERDHAGEGGY